VGLPVPGSALRIVDPDTLEDVPHGRPGRILIGGTQVMLGYLGRGDEGAVIERDGIRWFATQDIGWLDEDGFLVLGAGGDESRQGESENP
jgi:acyl-[acyl-carrier-protein]-phospholipid O-acyltransferase/long-chain-fatty-acid--[acyl-carrier-protein] ligase